MAAAVPKTYWNDTDINIMLDLLIEDDIAMRFLDNKKGRNQDLFTRCAARVEKKSVDQCRRKFKMFEGPVLCY